MTTTVTVVDYGLGNLFSVSRALTQVGAHAEFAQSAAGIEKAGYLLLPGVGAFQDGMQELHNRGLVEPLRRFAASGRPLLGICLGMQMLFEASEEFGNAEGLGIVPGRVIAIPSCGADGRPHKIPHIGWSPLLVSPARNSWAGTLLGAIAPATPAYFVHSYTCLPTREPDRLADCDYDGCLISAAVQRDSVSGVQFHPEKSGEAGLRVLKQFIAPLEQHG